VGRDRPPGLALCLGAAVGAAVEAPAGGALVDPSRARCQGLAQPGRVAARLLHLIGCRRPVDAAVGQPAARPAAARAAARLGAVCAAVGGLLDQLLQVGLFVQLLELPFAGPPERLLERVSQRPRRRRTMRVAAAAGVGVPAGAWRALWRVGRSDDRPVLLCGVVERLELPVRYPDQPCEQAVERAQVLRAEHLPPHLAQPAEVGGVDDPVVAAGLQVDGGAAGHVAAHRPAGNRRRCHLLAEGGDDHVDHGGLQRARHEPPADARERVLADAVGLHPGLLEQPPVVGQLPLVGVSRGGEGDVALERPALGVLGVERLVQRYAEAAQHGERLEPAGEQLLAGAEQRVRVEVDLARVELDVAGVGEAGADQRPDRVEPLQHPRPVVGQLLVERVELAALRGRALQLAGELAAAVAAHTVTARG
jgi:hypothetical protein